MGTWQPILSAPNPSCREKGSAHERVLRLQGRAGDGAQRGRAAGRPARHLPPGGAGNNRGRTPPAGQAGSQREVPSVCQAQPPSKAVWGERPCMLSTLLQMQQTCKHSRTASAASMRHSQGAGFPSADGLWASAWGLSIGDAAAVLCNNTSSPSCSLCPVRSPADPL